MNKKSIDTLLEHQNYNNQLFKQSISLVQSIKNTHPVSKIPIELSRNKPQLKKKQQILQTQLSKAIKLFGKILGTQKNSLGTITDHAVDVFEQLTDLIQGQCKSFIQKKKNIKKEIIVTQITNQTQSNRIQDKYPFVKPCEFNRHIHRLPSTQWTSLKCQVITPSSPLNHPYIYVSNLQTLQKTIQQLICCKQIAVDLQHSSKSYQGFTCLIQISTRKQDYIIDVFPIWNHIHKLKQVFENQRILKIMHGAQMDTKWLQRDFDIHIVNLFDTYKASRVLGYPKFSYAYLLNHYCDTITDKKYQLADWRQRPLSVEMLHYARLDTHYLLEIWDKILKDLWKQAETMNIQPQNVIKDVYSSSHNVTLNEVQLFTYKKKEIYQNIKNDTKPEDFKIIQSIFWVIDKVARQEDQSFDQLINKRTLVDILGRTKDLIVNKKATIQMLRVKIDRLIGIIRSHKHEKIALLLTPLKKQLQLHFLEPKKQINTKISKSQMSPQPLVCKLGTRKQQKGSILKPFNQQQFRLLPSQLSIEQLQYPLKTYQNFSIQQKQINKKCAFSMLVFQPVMSFLSKKFNLTQKDNEINQQEQKSQSMDLEQQHVEEEEKNQNQQEQDGFLEFKRIKPNVIYTIEEEQQVQQAEKKPKKKRKQLQYQQKLKNKDGNIYDLLEQV